MGRVIAISMLLTLIFVYSISSVVAYNIIDSFTLDADNRIYPTPGLVKEEGVTINYEGKAYNIGIGSFDFANNRITIQLEPQLGTDIITLNNAIAVDLDKDAKNDVSIELTNFDANAGVNEFNEIGTVFLLIGLEGPIETTTTSTTTTTPVKENISQEPSVVTAESTASEGFIDKINQNWIYIAIVILIIFLVVIFRKQIPHHISKIKLPKPQRHAKVSAQLHGNQKPCPKCGKSIVKGDKFCIHCGNNLKEDLFCTECGAKLRDDNKFCQSCGHKTD